MPGWGFVEDVVVVVGAMVVVGDTTIVVVDDPGSVLDVVVEEIVPPLPLGEPELEPFPRGALIEPGESIGTMNLPGGINNGSGGIKE